MALVRTWIGALAALVAIALVAPRSARVWAARRDFVGTAVCGSCHPAQLAAWQTTAHARVRTELASACRGCHGTGDAPAGRAYTSDVGCEACHGAGAAYAADDLMRNPALAVSVGLVDLAQPQVRARVCARCHAGVTTRLVGVELSAPAHPPPLPKPPPKRPPTTPPRPAPGS